MEKGKEKSDGVIASDAEDGYISTNALNSYDNSTMKNGDDDKETLFKILQNLSIIGNMLA